MTSNPSQRGLSLTLDFANEFIQFKPQEYFTMTLATSLHEDGDDEEVAGGSSGAAGGPDEASKKVTKREMWRGGDEGLAEQYEYVMHGKVSLDRGVLRGGSQIMLLC
jgi:DNA-directed RNA polymerase I, II, and III subunit RPABC3